MSSNAKTELSPDFKGAKPFCLPGKGRWELLAALDNLRGRREVTLRPRTSRNFCPTMCGNAGQKGPRRGGMPVRGPLC